MSETYPTVREEKIPGAGGVNIFVRSWRPVGRARSVVVLVHGFNAHSGHYSWVAQQLTADGQLVYALDLRGRGLSDGERYYVKDMSEYVGDVARVVALARSREADLPLFVLGHSAGGIAACIYALEHEPELAGLICESFALQVPAPDFALAALKGLSRIAPHARVLKLRNEDFSRDPEVVRALNVDPLISHEAQPTSTVAAMVRADARLKKDFPQLKLPVLIIHGTADKATRPAGSQLFYDTVGSADKTLKLYDGYYHDMLNDVGKERVMGDIRGWVNNHLPAG